ILKRIGSSPRCRVRSLRRKLQRAVVAQLPAVVGEGEEQIRSVAGVGSNLLPLLLWRSVVVQVAARSSRSQVPLSLLHEPHRQPTPTFGIALLSSPDARSRRLLPEAFR